MKILITGFEPFGGEAVNPSWEAVKRLPDELPGTQIAKVLLPVEYERAAERVRREIGEMGPDAVISVGQAGGRDAISVEYAALNVRSAEASDNAGRVCRDERIDAEGENAVFATLPVRMIESAINEAGIKARVSFSAGTFVCNEVMYAAINASSAPAGFIHVPFERAQAAGKTAPFMDADDIARAVRIALETVILALLPRRAR